MLGLDKLPDHVQIFIGILLILVGCSFVYKTFLAVIRGKLYYWSGFLPFTLLSPFTMHLPAGKRSLVKETEGLWVHMVMGPIFLICSILALGAGCDLAGLPGTSSVNWVLCGGKAGTAITFDRRRGYSFPIIAKAGPVLSKLFGTEVGIAQKDKYDVEGNNQSYAQVESGTH